MKKRIICIFGLPVCLMVAGLHSCGNKMSDINDLTRKPKLQDIAYGVQMYYSKDGRVSATIEATEFLHAQSARPPYVDMRKGIRARFYDDSMQVRNTLTAKTARYFEDQGNILIRDSIVVVNEKGEQLETEELVWNQVMGMYYTEKPVKITTAGQTIFGDGLNAPQDFSWYKITHVRGMVGVQKGTLPQ
jgi:LPS export ABC transporter protein LptC